MSRNMFSIYNFSNNAAINASIKRDNQLELWEKSETNRQSNSISASRKKPLIQFDKTVLFMHVAYSGNNIEVEGLVLEERLMSTLLTRTVSYLFTRYIHTNFVIVIHS